MPTQYMEVKTEKTGRGLTTFEWSGAHDVCDSCFEDRVAFELCDFTFTKATELSFRSDYVFKGDVGTYYFGCTIYGHSCGAGMKMQFDITDGTTTKGLSICTMFTYTQSCRSFHT